MLSSPLPLQVEPGGSNEANDSLNDRTHRPAASKRPRHPVPATAAAATAAGACAHRSNTSTPAAASASSSTRAALRPQTTARAAVHNPYATAPAGATATAPPATAATSSTRAAVPPSASRALGAVVHNPYAPKRPGEPGGGRGGGPGGGRVLGCSSQQGRSLVGSEGVGTPRTGLEPRGGQEYAEWKERVLESMENRVKENSASCSPAAVTATGAATGAVH